MFSGAAEAVGAAVAIQQAVGAHVQHHPDDRLSVRIGISAGDVTLEDDDCFGTPVVEASRCAPTRVATRSWSPTSSVSWPGAGATTIRPRR